MGESVAGYCKGNVGEGGEGERRNSGGSSTSMCEVRVSPSPTRTIISIGTMPCCE